MRSKREACHSPLSSAEANNEWRYTSTPLYASMAYTGSNVRISKTLIHLRNPLPGQTGDLCAHFWSNYLIYLNQICRAKNEPGTNRKHS
jgi:hypothetical protein